MKKILIAVLTLIVATTGLTAAAVFINNSDLTASILAEESESESETEPKVKTANTYDEYIEKGNLLLENNYYTLAITEYSLAAQAKPQAAEPYVLMGNIYLTTGEPEKALSEFEKALEKSPQNIKAIIGIAQSRMDLGEFTEARSAIDGASAQESTELKYYEGILHAFDKEYESSENLFLEIQETSEDEELLEKCQYFLDAYTEYAQEQGGQEAHLRTLLAQAATEVEQYNLAIEILYDVLSENADYRDAWILLGYAYLNLEEYEDSASAFEQAIELDVTKPETNYFLALAYFGQDKLEKSINYLELALVYGFEPQVQVYQKLAESYFIMEDYENAARNYEQVLQLNDSDINYFVRPIWINMDYLEKLDHALELAEWAVSSHPEEAMSYNLKGWVLLETDNYDEAEDELEKALDMDENLAAAYLNLGSLYEEKEDFEKAKEYYKQAYILDQNDSVGNLAAEKYNKLVDNLPTP